MKCKTLGVAALLVLAAAARPQDEATKKDLQRMQGSWSAAIHEANGKKTTEEEAKKANVKLIVKDGTYTVFFGEKQVTTGSLKLDAAKKPKQVDAIAEDGPSKGKAMPGIYELNGDKMRVCFGQPGKDRPTEFRTREGTGQVLIHYQRIKE